MMNDNFYRSSGAAIAIKRISLAMTEVDYCVAGCSDEGLEEDLSWIPPGKYERFNLKISNPILIFSELFRFRRWFKAQKCDLIHCHHRRMAVLLQAFGMPVLYTGQLVFPPSAWFRYLRPRLTTAITPSVAANLRETTGRETLACIGNPVDFPLHPPRPELVKVRDKAVCIGRLAPVKGHRYLLAAWKLLRDRGRHYRLDLVGEGPLRSELEDQVKRDGTKDLVRFCGFAPNVRGVIADSLFAILVSEVEGQGIVTVEAASMGRASLLTAVPGSIDLIPPRTTLKNGLKFGDVIETADAIEEWFTRPEEALSEGVRFFHFLKESSDPAGIARAYTDVYKQIVSNGYR
jgi:glycosyltransferase involved in cell wall biosynthesis